MKRIYNLVTDELTNKEIIWYEENGFRVSFTPDPANSDYQAYLEQSTENPTEDVE